MIDSAVIIIIKIYLTIISHHPLRINRYALAFTHATPCRSSPFPSCLACYAAPGLSLPVRSSPRQARPLLACLATTNQTRPRLASPRLHCHSAPNQAAPRLAVPRLPLHASPVRACPCLALPAMPRRAPPLLALPSLHSHAKPGNR